MGTPTMGTIPSLVWPAIETLRFLHCSNFYSYHWDLRVGNKKAHQLPNIKQVWASYSRKILNFSNRTILSWDKKKPCEANSGLSKMQQVVSCKQQCFCSNRLRSRNILVSKSTDDKTQGESWLSNSVTQRDVADTFEIFRVETKDDRSKGVAILASSTDGLKQVQRKLVILKLQKRQHNPINLNSCNAVLCATSAP